MPAADIRRIFAGKQTRFRVPVCSYMPEKNVQQYAIPNFDTQSVTMEYPGSTGVTSPTLVLLNNPFAVLAPEIPIRESYWSGSIDGVKYAFYAFDMLARRRETTEEPSVVYTKTGIKVTRENFLKLARFPYFIPAFKMRKSLIRLKLHVLKTGIEYWNSRSAFREEGYETQDEQREAWIFRYRNRPDFSFLLNPICFYVEFTAP